MSKEDNEKLHDEPEIKRRKNETDYQTDELNRIQTTQTSVVATVAPKEEMPPYLPAIMGCRSVGEFQCLNK